MKILIIFFITISNLALVVCQNQTPIKPADSVLDLLIEMFPSDSIMLKNSDIQGLDEIQLKNMLHERGGVLKEYYYFFHAFKEKFSSNQLTNPSAGMNIQAEIGTYHNPYHGRTEGEEQGVSELYSRIAVNGNLMIGQTPLDLGVRSTNYGGVFGIPVFHIEYNLDQYIENMGGKLISADDLIRIFSMQSNNLDYLPDDFEMETALRIELYSMLKQSLNVQVLEDHDSLDYDFTTDDLGLPETKKLKANKHILEGIKKKALSNQYYKNISAATIEFNEEGLHSQIRELLKNKPISNVQKMALNTNHFQMGLFHKTGSFLTGQGIPVNGLNWDYAVSNAIDLNLSSGIDARKLIYGQFTANDDFFDLGKMPFFIELGATYSPKTRHNEEYSLNLMFFNNKEHQITALDKSNHKMFAINFRHNKKLGDKMVFKGEVAANLNNGDEVEGVMENKGISDQLLPSVVACSGGIEYQNEDISLFVGGFFTGPGYFSEMNPYLKPNSIGGRFEFGVSLFDNKLNLEARSHIRKSLYPELESIDESKIFTSANMNWRISKKVFANITFSPNHFRAMVDDGDYNYHFKTNLISANLMIQNQNSNHVFGYTSYTHQTEDIGQFISEGENGFFYSFYSYTDHRKFWSGEGHSFFSRGFKKINGYRMALKRGYISKKGNLSLEIGPLAYREPHLSKVLYGGVEANFSNLWHGKKPLRVAFRAQYSRAIEARSQYQFRGHLSIQLRIL